MLSDPDTKRKYDMGAYDPSDPTGGMNFGGMGGMGGMGGIDPS